MDLKEKQLRDVLCFHVFGNKQEDVLVFDIGAVVGASVCCISYTLPLFSLMEHSYSVGVHFFRFALYN